MLVHTPPKHQMLPEAQAIVGSVLDLKAAISDHHKCSQARQRTDNRRIT